MGSVRSGSTVSYVLKGINTDSSTDMGVSSSDLDLFGRVRSLSPVMFGQGDAR